MRRPEFAPLVSLVALLALGPVAAVAVCGEAQAPPRDPALDRILGEWRGNSVCVDLEKAPFCHDEVVIYDFTRGDGWHADRTHLKAYKVVDGRRELMGELDFDYDRAAGTWKCEFEAPRVHGRWSFQVEEDRLTGMLVELPSEAVLRKVSAPR